MAKKKMQHTEPELKKERKKTSPMDRFIRYVIEGIVLYCLVTLSFRQAIPCNPDASKTACECIKNVLSEKVPFVDKVRILLNGASREELSSYFNYIDTLSCAFR